MKSHYNKPKISTMIKLVNLGRTQVKGYTALYNIGGQPCTYASIGNYMEHPELV